MASSSNHPLDFKKALSVLQDEIKAAKDKVMTRECQLEKAIQERNQVSSFEKLLDSASANLTCLQREKVEILKHVSEFNFHPSTSDDQIQEISPTSEGSSKQRKVDDLIGKLKNYLLRTESWGCVTVINKKRAVTFAHSLHDTLQPGETMDIFSFDGSVKYKAKVVSKNTESDWVLLESDVDLCEKKPIWGHVIDGRGYYQLGLSATTQEESPFSISKGVISSSRLNIFGHTLGSAGANPGDSGGPCFDESTGELIGINVGCENASFNPDKDTVTQAYHKVGSRHAARAHIIPVNCFQFLK
jgi:hypothetical protein